MPFYIGIFTKMEWVYSKTDYYPFGMEMSERKFVSEGYRWGFNGMERDDEFKGSGNSVDFGARMLDVRLGRWMSIEPNEILFAPISPYVSVLNNPICFTDLDGATILGLDGKPISVTFGIGENGKFDGSVTVSPNANFATRVIVSALAKTPSGRNAIIGMVLSPTDITLQLTDEPIPGAYAATEPQTYQLTEDGFPMPIITDGFYDKATITVSTYQWKTGRFRYAVFDEFINAVISHESIHILSKAQIIRDLFYNLSQFYGIDIAPFDFYRSYSSSDIRTNSRKYLLRYKEQLSLVTEYQSRHEFLNLRVKNLEITVRQAIKLKGFLAKKYAKVGIGAKEPRKPQPKIIYSPRFL